MVPVFFYISRYLSDKYFDLVWGCHPASRGGVEDIGLEAKAKDTKNPRPRTALPRIDPLEAKHRNARGQGQGPRTPAQVFSKKSFFQAIPKQNKEKNGLQKFFLLQVTAKVT